MGNNILQKIREYPLTEVHMLKILQTKKINIILNEMLMLRQKKKLFICGKPHIEKNKTMAP